MIRRAGLASMAALGVLSATACASVLVRGGPGYDAGTVAVSGVESGIGGQAEAVVYVGPRASGFGVGPSLQWSGYSTAGDADPMAFTTLELRARRRLAERGFGAPYWEVGSGVGLGWVPALRRVVLPLQAELGYQTLVGRSTIVSAGLRERLLVLAGSGSPPVDLFNSVQLILGLGYSAGEGR